MALTKKDLDNFRNQLVEAVDLRFKKQDERISQGFKVQDERIAEVMNDRFDAISEHFVTKNDLINAKNEIMNTLDTFAKEVRDNREERTVQAEHIRRNTRRIEKLESKAGIVAS